MKQPHETEGRLLSPSSAILVAVDYQVRMMAAIHDREGVLARAEKLVRGARLLDVPILVTEQYPQGIGRTEPALVEALGAHYLPIEKMTMSVWAEPAFRDALAAAGRRQIILCGVEAHVCVCQSAIELRGAGYDVYVAADCVSSRRTADVDVALRRMQQAGCWMSTHEMAVFEMLRVAGTPAFKEWIGMIR